MANNSRELNKQEPRFERRRYQRIAANFVVSYIEVPGPSKADISQTKNISEGGVLFTADRKFQKGAILNLKLRLPDAFDIISLNVEVMDSKEIGKGFLYDTRAKFVNLKDEIRTAIKRVVEYGLQKPKT